MSSYHTQGILSAWIVAFGGKYFESCARRQMKEKFSDARNSQNILPRISIQADGIPCIHHYFGIFDVLHRSKNITVFCQFVIKLLISFNKYKTRYPHRALALSQS